MEKAELKYSLMLLRVATRQTEDRFTKIAPALVALTDPEDMTEFFTELSEACGKKNPYHILESILRACDEETHQRWFNSIENFANVMHSQWDNPIIHMLAEDLAKVEWNLEHWHEELLEQSKDLVRTVDLRMSMIHMHLVFSRQDEQFFCQRLSIAEMFHPHQPPFPHRALHPTLTFPLWRVSLVERKPTFNLQRRQHEYGNYSSTRDKGSCVLYPSVPHRTIDVHHGSVRPCL